MNNLENLNILITGASGGIGTSLSKAFASTNANLFLVGSSDEKYLSYEINFHLKKILTLFFH